METMPGTEFILSIDPVLGDIEKIQPIFRNRSPQVLVNDYNLSIPYRQIIMP